MDTLSHLYQLQRHLYRTIGDQLRNIRNKPWYNEARFRLTLEIGCFHVLNCLLSVYLVHQCRVGIRMNAAA